MHTLKTIHDQETGKDVLVYPLKKKYQAPAMPKQIIRNGDGKYPLFRAYRNRSQRFEMRVSVPERLLLEKAVMTYPGQGKTSILVTAFLEFCDRYNITLEPES